MRKLTVGVAVSTALHAAAIAVVCARGLPGAAARTERQTTPIEVVPVRAPAPSEPLATVLLADPPAATSHAPAPRRSIAAPAPRSAPRSAPPSGEGSIAAPRAGSASETAPPQPSPWLAMRRGEAPRLALPRDRWDPLDRVPAGTRPEKKRTTGILHESGRGTYESDQGGFIGKVNPDGTVKLHDKSSASIRLALPSPKDVGRAIASWYEAEKGPYGETGEAPLAKHLQVSAGPATDQGDEAHPEHRPDTTLQVAVPVLSGGLEVTDWLMRRNGIDPYASRKLKLLDATRDERVQIGNRHRAQQLALTPQIVRRNLDQVWTSISDARARKQALFELWDECAETGEPAVVAGGEAARRLVVGFIRTHLPAGSADAYTAAELAAFARTQRSRSVFQPYDPTRSP